MHVKKRTFNILLKSSIVSPIMNPWVDIVPYALSFNILLKSPVGLVFVWGFKVFPPCSLGFVGTHFCS